MRWGHLVNRVLASFGLRLQRIHISKSDKKVAGWKFEEVLHEFHDVATSQFFPGLPPKAGRLDLLSKLEGTTIIESLWILDSVYKTLEVDGDYCEFGVAAGATATLVANELRDSNKLLWLFDSFEGLPEPTEKDFLINDFWNLGSIEAYQGTMKYPADTVRCKLSSIGFPEGRVRIIAGFIEETIEQSPLPEMVSLAFVDFDFYKPILTALNFLAGHLSDGGHIIVDDYGDFSAGAQAAVDEFYESHQGSFSLEIAPAWAGHFAVLEKKQ